MKNSVLFKIARGFTPAVSGWKSKTLCGHQKGRDGGVNSGSSSYTRCGILLETGEAGLNPYVSLANVFCRTYHRHWRRFPAAALGECRESETVPTSQSRE